MNKQFFLQMLKDDLESRYLLNTKNIEPSIHWTPDSLMNLSVIIENFVMDNYGLFEDLIDKDSIKVIISESTLDRIFKSGERDTTGKMHEEYNVEDPIRRVRRKILDILCRFLQYDSWDDFVYSKNLATKICDEIDVEVEKLLKKEFDSYKSLPIAIGYKQPGVPNPTLDAHSEHTAVLLGSFKMNMISNTIKWGWTIHNENNPSTYEINELTYLGVNENPHTAIFHLGITFYLSMYSQITQEFVENVIVETVERVYAQKVDDKWVFKPTMFPLLFRWVKCSRTPDVILDQSETPKDSEFIS